MNRLKILFRSLLFFALILPASFAFSQTQIQILNADVLEGRKDETVNTKRLIGNVRLRHKDIILNCDSANLYSDENKVDAFGHVHIIQGDSIHIYGDSLKYFGNIKKAFLYHHVLLTDKTMELITDELEYDTEKKIGTYYKNAVLKDRETTLTSVTGYYLADSDNLLFRKNVVLTNPDYTLTADTLRYNIQSSVAYFLGPTHIRVKKQEQEETRIYCEDGWYDTEKNIARFIRNAKMENEGKTIAADTLDYDKKKAFGRAVNHIEWTDTAQKIIINSDYAEYFEKEESIWATKKAIMTLLMDDDSLYLSADTLKSAVRHRIVIDSPDTGSKKKSARYKADTTGKYRILLAYHHAKIYKSNLQAVCDSIFYSESDSTFRFLGNPVLWSNNSQLKADTITMNMANGHLQKVNLYQGAFISNEAFRNEKDTAENLHLGTDSLFYNQIKGKNIYGYFEENELNRMLVEGNGQSIYYGKDDSNAYLGVNKAECSNMWLWFKDDKVDKITFLSKPDATFHPIQKINPSGFFLKNFIWLGSKRPKSKADLLK